MEDCYKDKTKESFIEELKSLKQREIEQKFALEHSKFDNKHIEHIYKLVPSAIFTVDIGKRITSWNRMAEEITGYKADEVIGNTCLIFAEEPCTKGCCLYSEKIKKPVRGKECTIKTKDGRHLIISKNIDVLKYHTDEIIGGIESFEDVTMRKKMIDTIIDSERLYRTLFNGISDSIFIHDESGNIFDVNRIACDVLGYTREELLKMNISDINLSDDLKEAIKNFKKIKGEENIVFETEYISKKGARIPIEMNSRLVEYAGMIAVLSVARDITMRKKIEEKMLQEKRLESVGMLAGGIAHDFNNFLMVIKGNLDMIRSLSPEENDLSCYFEAADQYIKSAKKLSYQLLTFAQGGKPVIEVVSIKDILKEFVIFSLHGRNVKPVFSIDENLFNAEVDPGQINQVINNIVINAAQAMPKGGILDVRAKNIKIDKKHGIELPMGDYVEISIKDTGKGIKESILKKIFIPFFTTKETGKGMGLAISQSIIKNHGGYITVLTEENKGTEFIFYIPTTKKKVEDKKYKYKKMKVSDDMLNILIMDDDEGITQILSDFLRKMNYKVEAVKDGYEALEKYTKYLEDDKKFDVVFLDLTIPGGMGGKDTIAELKNIDKDVTAIVMSGYSKDPVLSEYKKYGFKAVIKKPFNLENVLENIENLKKRSDCI
ncbi:MAG: PAS domain S-box protein [Candidatus Aureabacteria bacterium]|nr:PAS domain S-box protein [Candidatus Auribacterota bacterium]